MEFFNSLNYVTQAFLAATFTFFVTALGSSIVLFFKKVNQNIMDLMLSLAAGVMLAASYFSLLNPSIETSINLGKSPWVVASIGILLGSLLLFFSDKIFDKLLKNAIDNGKKRVTLLTSSIIIHNIPEGLSIGVAFGSIKYGLDGVSIISALALAIGIGIQNFPEGSAVSLPLRREGLSRKTSFIIGSLSGIVEPISAVIGCLLVLKIRNILPLLLSFAAGAMIYVVIEELIPESQKNKNKNLMALSTMIGFIIMMVLDIALG